MKFICVLEFISATGLRNDNRRQAAINNVNPSAKTCIGVEQFPSILWALFIAAKTKSISEYSIATCIF